VRQLLHSACRVSDQILIVTGGNLALAPGLVPPFRWLWGWRHRAVRQLFLDEVHGDGVRYMDLFRRAAEDPTTTDPARFFAEDGLHPSDDNYALWFDEMARAIRRPLCTAPAAPTPDRPALVTR
jgi:hypothetical protein